MKVTKRDKNKNPIKIEFSSEELFAIWFYQFYMVPRIIENLSDEEIKRFNLLAKKKK